MGEPIRTREGKLVERGEHDARLGRVVQVKNGAEEIRSFELSGKEIFSNYDEMKSKEEKNKNNGSKKKAHCGQSVRYRSVPHTMHCCTQLPQHPMLRQKF